MGVDHFQRVDNNATLSAFALIAGTIVDQGEECLFEPCRITWCVINLMALVTVSNKDYQCWAQGAEQLSEGLVYGEVGVLEFLLNVDSLFSGFKSGQIGRHCSSHWAPEGHHGASQGSRFACRLEGWGLDPRLCPDSGALWRSSGPRLDNGGLWSRGPYRLCSVCSVCGDPLASRSLQVVNHADPPEHLWSRLQGLQPIKARLVTLWASEVYTLQALPSTLR
ncbi:hypothetical protein EGW08_012626 [Elysia chlorotica]|uniref:Uncharacterized protein n=1 Tax=Elysia chlorotica TaxID=188477 RepID=A0A3S1BFL1_ELYCH|nr:hypothetical protein EGW08_012626 [Elysia chlorotica]